MIPAIPPACFSVGEVVVISLVVILLVVLVKK